MKIFIILVVCSIISIAPVYSQSVNWNWLEEENPNHLHLNVGYDFGFATQFGYSRYFKVFKPALLTIDYSLPMGNILFDDFKIRYGGQVEIAEWNNFKASMEVFGNLKRHETKLVRIVNFGIESLVHVGYYNPKWHMALEFGTINPLITNMKHSQIVTDNYPDIQNGWYGASGGYFQYGIQGSKTIGSTFNLSGKIGYTNAFGIDKDAMLPYYANLGLMKRF